jgi:hypothetical protein
MADSPLERGARALEEALRHEVSELPPEIYHHAVKCVLQAIREPSDEMVAAFGFVQRRHSAENPGARVWREMIDVVLDEDEGLDP